MGDFKTLDNNDQWVVDRLIQHEGHDIGIEVLEDEVLLSCVDCNEIVLNFFREGALDD